MPSTSYECHSPGWVRIPERLVHLKDPLGQSCLRTIVAALVFAVTNDAHALDTPATPAPDARSSSVRATDSGDAFARPQLRLREPSITSSTASKDWLRTPGQLALTVGVPFFDDSLLHGDVTVDIRYGRKYWWFVPYVSGGFRATRMDPAQVPPEARRDKVYAWHATLGMRFEIPATRQLFPFVGLAGEVGYWAFTEDSTGYCHKDFYPDAWRCYRPNEYKRGTALKPQIGLLYKPEPSLALEFWVEYGIVQASEMFTRRVGFIHPAVGVAWHH